MCKKLVNEGKVIEEYIEDSPYPSLLTHLYAEKRHLHIVVSMDLVNNWAYVITAYEPDQKTFESDFVTRRKIDE